jgi:four helix bundle protein
VERAAARSFRDLVVWQKAHGFVLETYKLSARFPREEQFGLTAQFRRSAVSIAANIAEGFRKRSGPDKRRFLNIAEGSLEECRYYLILAQDLGYANTNELQESLSGVSRLLMAYSNAITRNSQTPRLLDSSTP